MCRIGYPSLSYGQLPRTDGQHWLVRRRAIAPLVSQTRGRARWRTGRREVPPNLLEWLRMYAQAIDRLPPLPKDWTRG